MNEKEELQFLREEVKRKEEELRIANKNWKFENERLQLALDGSLAAIKELSNSLEKEKKMFNDYYDLVNPLVTSYKDQSLTDYHDWKRNQK